MPTEIRDVKLTLRDQLRVNWDNTSLPTALSDDDIHTGWYDDGKGFPQVTVTNDEQSVAGGGVTGFSGITSNGSGGTQHRAGTALVTAWAGSRDDYDARGEAEVQAEEMASVVEDAITANQQPGKLLSLAVTGRSKLVDTDEDPVEHGHQFTVSFTWLKTPA